MNSKTKSFFNDERTRISACFLFFFFMMRFNLMHSPLWGDEWVEYYYSQESIITGDLYKAIISTFQPPLYNHLMHLWLKISQSLLWFRLFNVAIGFITAIFIYKTNRKQYSKKVGAISIVALAVCYRWVYCIQAWCSGWGREEWQATIDKARSLGYSVIVCNDSGSAGQLAYCILE